MMTPELELGAAVVTANRFNPSVISQIWLVKSGVTGENDFGPTCIFTPDLVQVGTTTFNLTCTPDQLQFAPVGDSARWGGLAQDGLGKILRSLPHTPFTAIGLNFGWSIRLDSESAAATTRKSFAGKSPLYDHFSLPDARFGAYLSRDYEDMRLRLSVTPVAKEGIDALRLSFNFHRLVGEQPVDEMLSVLSKWDRAVEFSKQLCAEVTKGGLG